MEYNSFWRLSIEQLEKKLKEKEDMFYNEKNSEENRLFKKGFSLSKKITNIPFSNLTNRNSYKNMNSLRRESIFNKNNILKGIENTNINFNLNRKYNLNEQNPLNFKSRLNTMINRHPMKLDNKNLISIYNRNMNSNQNKENKNNSNKTIILNNIKKKKDSLPENNKITYTENNEVNSYKSINRDNYKKKLIENFEHEMESQRVAKKKTRTKIFLPPLIRLSPGKYNFPLNLNTENSRNLKKKKISYFRKQKY